MESYVKHAKENLTNARVLVISNDAAVKRSGERFYNYGIIIDFLEESEIVGKLKTLLNDEVAAFIDEKDSRLEEYILKYESMILDFVKNNPFEITEWMLDGPLTRGEDRIIGSIEGILSVRPRKI
ncbi:MAG: hypothetical protein MUP73_04470, partial [Dehalococcoidia bacterium]|nr:hypothetical protein [Dehalococcoidia bacterium]